MNFQCHAIILTFAVLTFTTHADSSIDNELKSLSMSSGELRVQRSPRYNFGLGKRRFIITTGEPGKKRLPHYNFGLGKRLDFNEASNFDDNSDSNLASAEKSRDIAEYPGYIDNMNDMNMNVISDDYDSAGFPSEGKRSKGYEKYGFGLGKRRVYNFGLGKRKNDEYEKRFPNYPRFNFGLGRR